MLQFQHQYDLSSAAVLENPPGQEIVLENITKAWGDTIALDGVSLTIPSGSFTALLGPSGCGKSTALRLISGLEAASDGRILIGGEDVTEQPPSKRDIAMVFQSYALFPHLSVAENIIFGLKVRKVPRAERDEKLKRTADLLGLSALLDRKPSQLSGGQQQRVALGRAIVADKSIFLMDEPLSNLDAKLRAEMREEIRDLHRRLGVTIVYVTHDQVEAVTMADQVVLLNHGTVEQVASPRDLYEMPVSQFVAGFIGTPPMVVFSPKVLNNLDTLDERLQPGKALFGIRPEALKVTEEGLIKATVAKVEFLGADLMVDCNVAGELLTSRLPGNTKVKAGDALELAFELHDLHVFSADTGERLQADPKEFGAIFNTPKPARKSQSRSPKTRRKTSASTS